jgi:hypothetical protein
MLRQGSALYALTEYSRPGCDATAVSREGRHSPRGVTLFLNVRGRRLMQDQDLAHQNPRMTAGYLKALSGTLLTADLFLRS